MIRKRIIAVAQKPPQKVLKENNACVYPICVINTHTRPLSRPLAPKRSQDYDE